MKVICAAFLLLQFGFVSFWWKNIGAKGAHKMLMKLTIGQRIRSSESGLQTANTSKATTR